MEGVGINKQVCVCVSFSLWARYIDSIVQIRRILYVKATDTIDEESAMSERRRTDLPILFSVCLDIWHSSIHIVIRVTD